MTTSSWGWRRARRSARQNPGVRSLAAFVAAAPWLTVVLLLVMLHMIGGALTAAEGVLFDLPSAGLAEGETTKLVALALAMPRETLVFFDDARYSLGDGYSSSSLGEHLGERVRTSGETTLLVLADRKVPAGDLMNLAAVARLGGVKRVLFANKRAEGHGE